MSVPNTLLDTLTKGVNIDVSAKATQADNGRAFQVVKKKGMNLDMKTEVHH
jgi:hypothetical protein